jgi:hypothetical protein
VNLSTFVQGGQVEATAEVPDEPGLVVAAQQILQGHGGDDPLPIHLPQPWRRTLAHDPFLTAAL